MALGELTIADISCDNVANLQFQPNAAVVLDIANSTGGKVAVALPAAALAEPFGVVVSQSKTFVDPNTGAITVAPGSGVTVRQIGIAVVTAAGTIAAGDHLSIANAAGQVQTQARAGAGVQPVPILGRALNAATVNQGVFVVLTPGATY